jgi:hypothetical protein
MLTPEPAPAPRGAARKSSSTVARRGGPAQRALDARTLYLAGTEPLRLTSTGEALVVSRPGMPAQRLPINRILRVVCANPLVDWSGVALTLCLQHGVVVSWLGLQGQAQGQLWPTRSRAVALAELLDLLAADDPGWPDSWYNWLRHQRQGLVNTWRRQRELAHRPVSEGEWLQAQQHIVYRNDAPQLLPELLHGLAAALIAARLNDDGLAPRYNCWGGEPLELAIELARLVWIEMNLCAGPLAAAIERPQEAAAIFEHWAGTCVGALHAHLAQLHGHAQRRLDAPTPAP